VLYIKNNDSFDVTSASIGGIVYRKNILDTSHVQCTESEVSCNLFWREKMKDKVGYIKNLPTTDHIQV